MIKYTEDIEKMIISVENYNAFLTKKTGEMTLGGKVLNKIFDLLSRLFSGISDYFDSKLIIIDLVLFVGLPFVLSGCLGISENVFVFKTAISENIWAAILLLIFNPLNYALFITVAQMPFFQFLVDLLGSGFSLLAEKYENKGITKKYNDGVRLQNRLSKLYTWLRFEQLYKCLVEKYSDRSIRIIKKQAETGKEWFQPMAIRIEKSYQDPDSIISEVDAVIVEKEFDFELEKELYKEIFGQEIDFTVIDKKIEQLKNDIADWSDERSEKEVVEKPDTLKWDSINKEFLSEEEIKKLEVEREEELADLFQPDWLEDEITSADASPLTKAQ